MLKLQSEDELRGVDMSEDLRLYHQKDERVKGLIYSQDLELVVQNFPVPHEYVLPRDQEQLQTRISQDLFPLDLFESIEGTVIRVYYFNDSWQLSTSSRINAFSSSWASDQSFGQQFEARVESISGNPLDVFLCSLDKERKYFFILPTSGLNRLGELPQEKESIYLIAIETMDHQLLYGSELPRDERNLWVTPKTWHVSTFTEWLQIVEKGYNVIYYSSDDALIRCVSDSYAERYHLRNNEPNLLLRYLQLLQEKQNEQCTQLESMYPEVNFSREIHDSLDRLIRLLHQEYIVRYIKKEKRFVPKPIFQLLRACHLRYLETRERTTLDTIRAHLLRQDCRQLLRAMRVQINSKKTIS